jgi:hypothetical protein
METCCVRFVLYVLSVLSYHMLCVIQNVTNATLHIKKHRRWGSPVGCFRSIHQVASFATSNKLVQLYAKAAQLSAGPVDELSAGRVDELSAGPVDEECDEVCDEKPRPYAAQGGCTAEVFGCTEGQV